MKFQLVTVNLTNFDGRVVASGTTVGTIESELPIDNVVSSLRSLQLAIVPDADYTPPELPPVTEKKTQPAPSTANHTEPAMLTPPDSTGPVESSLSDLEDVDPLAGLTAKVAQSLVEAAIDGKQIDLGSLDTPEKIQAAIDSGFDLADLDGIGPKAVVRIKEWLAALKG